jgi:uncharacterized protein
VLFFLLKLCFAFFEEVGEEMPMKHVVSWFEIPVTNIERAMTFYRTVVGADFQRMDQGSMLYATFAVDPDGITGALAQGEGFVPSSQGTTVYLAAADVSVPLSKVEAAGGKIVIPKTNIGENMGYFAQILDTEGNRVGLFSMS